MSMLPIYIWYWLANRFRRTMAYRCSNCIETEQISTGSIASPMAVWLASAGRGQCQVQSSRLYHWVSAISSSTQETTIGRRDPLAIGDHFEVYSNGCPKNTRGSFMLVWASHLLVWKFVYNLEVFDKWQVRTWMGLDRTIVPTSCVSLCWIKPFCLVTKLSTNHLARRPERLRRHKWVIKLRW